MLLAEILEISEKSFIKSDCNLLFDFQHPAMKQTLSSF